MGEYPSSVTSSDDRCAVIVAYTSSALGVRLFAFIPVPAKPPGSADRARSAPHADEHREWRLACVTEPARITAKPGSFAGRQGNMFKQRQQLKRQTLLEERAHEMRHQPTPSEAALWASLKRKQLGVAFRRQVLVGNRYIVDFLAPRIKLVVEVDGGYHSRRGVADARRERFLKKLGYRVVRVQAESVVSQLSQVVARVLTSLEDSESTHRLA